MSGRVSVNGWRRDNLYHMEFEGCIVNVRVGLSDRKGRNVTHVEIIPDDRDVNGARWRVSPRLSGVRVIRLKGR